MQICTDCRICGATLQIDAHAADTWLTPETIAGAHHANEIVIEDRWDLIWETD